MPLMNSHIVEECLPFTSLRLDPEDINLSMGAGYVHDAEIQAISDALKQRLPEFVHPAFCMLCSMPSRPVLVRWE